MKIIGLNKVVLLGLSQPSWTKRPFKVFVKIEYDDEKFRMTGVEGPLRSGNARGSCGQIDMPDIYKFAPGMTQYKMEILFDIWHAFHLSDMHAGCKHQRALGWGNRRLDDEKGVGWQYKHANLAGWVYYTENKKGVLLKPCPICGYKYGSGWHEGKTKVPQWALRYLDEKIPDSPVIPHWI